MGLEKNIFEDYFSNRIEKQDFIIKLGIDAQEFPVRLYEEINKECMSKDAQRLEFLIYALMLWEEEKGGVGEPKLKFFLALLNELLLCDWHTQHENIVDLLQKVSDESSIEFLYSAIHLDLHYLQWDDNYSFQTKCIRVIAKIGGEEAIGCLKKLEQKDNLIIKEMAMKKIEQLRCQSF